MRTPENASVAVLASGGLDSAILIAQSAAERAAVYPLYLREGLYWEPVELEHLHRFLSAIAQPSLRPLTVLEMPVKDLYGEHWSVTGKNVPAADTPDDAVYLPGRNLLFLAKALIWCRLNGVPELALGLLASNPFSDASDQFFEQMEKLAHLALGGLDGQFGPVHIRRPFVGLNKTEVLERGKGLPLEWTFSCIRPVNGLHCGRCNKCAERKKAFADAGRADPTAYA